MMHTPPPKGTNAERSRTLNRQAVLGQIHAAGAMGRAEIARSMGLSTQAVSNIIAELEEDGLLVERGTRSGGRGLPAVQYGLNPEGGYAMGVEVRPDAIFTALLDLQGDTIVTRRKATKSTKPHKVIARVVKMRDAMLEKAKVSSDRLLGAGIVMPGPFGETGLSGEGSDLPDWQRIDATSAFRDALEVPIELSNDANAAAMAERIGGAAQGIGNYAYLYFGAGLGLGLISQGRLVPGAFGNAGEIGHVPVPTPSGAAPLESLLSRLSVQRHLSGKGHGQLDFKELAALHAKGDADLLAWLSYASSALSHAVQIIENLFDPQTIILGGAMPESMLDQLVEVTELPTSSVSHRRDNPHPRLQRGTSGRMTATLGAASLVLNHAFTPQSAHS